MPSKEKTGINNLLRLCVLSVLWMISFGNYDYLFSFEHPRYQITADLDTASHTIRARQKLTYTNNSSLRLEELRFHIYPHRKYKENEIRFFYRYAGYFKVNPFPQGFQSGDLIVKSASSGGKTTGFSIEGEDQTILKVKIDPPLDPGQSRQIEIEFSVEIPHAYGRFGWHNAVICLNRWYPILCVLDENGWSDYPFYLYHHPYYSDAAYYNVTLTLPATYIVASSGVVKTQVLNPQGTKTLEIETEAPARDFSIGASERFCVYSLESGGLKINSYYLEGDRQKAIDAAENALGLIKFHSVRFGEYPYSSFSIVPSYLGYGGEQSSSLIFIDTRLYRLPGFLDRYFDFLISHETSHQWFYNIIGSDEYKEMFMDEGMNSFWTLRYLEDKYGFGAQVLVLPKFLRPIVPNFSFRDSLAFRYIYMAKSGMDRPVIGELSSFTEPSSIFALTYGKGAAVIDMLRALLTDEVFDEVIKRYTAEFRFKNAGLEDLIAVCNEVSGKDMGWFFEQWLLTAKTCDYAVKSVDNKNIILENRGTIQSQVKTRIEYSDGTSQSLDWDGKEKEYAVDLRGKTVGSVVVDPQSELSLDLDKTNNYWPRKRVFRPVPLYFFGQEMPIVLPKDSTNIVYGPTVGGSSLGLASSAQKPFQGILRLNSAYDFNGKAVDTKLGYEISPFLSGKNAVGLELFDYESSKTNYDVSGGKLYFRKDLWPASYGLFDVNDHVTLYFVRDQKMESSYSLNGREDIKELTYKRRHEAIIGTTGSFGRYGPYPDPDYGWKISGTQETAGHFLGGREAFWRMSAELSNYNLIFPKVANKIATRIKSGWGGSADKDLFELGGPQGLRGYDLKEIRGSRMVEGSVEYRFPVFSDLRLGFFDNILCMDKVQMVGFFDAGRAWKTDYSESDFKKDAGLGLRFHFDLAGLLEKLVIRFDAAEPINEPKEDTHFWLGINHVF